jgi:hypothetical protein
MGETRREFMKDAATVGAAAALAGPLTAVETKAEPAGSVPANGRCPYFDQPLFCGGPGPDGRYKCEE